MNNNIKTTFNLYRKMKLKLDYSMTHDLDRDLHNNFWRNLYWQIVGELRNNISQELKANE